MYAKIRYYLEEEKNEPHENVLGKKKHEGVGKKNCFFFPFFFLDGKKTKNKFQNSLLIFCTNTLKNGNTNKHISPVSGINEIFNADIG